MSSHIKKEDNVMSDHKFTESVEMYLATISMMRADNLKKSLPISNLAEELQVQPVSANQMVKKMAKEGLVKYIPYKGVKLTEKGKAQALRVLRHRRLWEVFLVRDLGMSLEDADALACDMEHITSCDVADRLSVFLGHPTVSFRGNPIPQVEREGVTLFEGMPLSDLQIGESAQVMRVNADALTTNFLFTEGIKPGVHARIVALGSGGDVLVECQDRRIRISAEMSSIIIVGQAEFAQKSKEESFMSVPLSELKVGERGKIIKLSFKGAARQRLMAMGLVKNEEILVRRVAPLGDPIDFVIKGYDLSLRKTEAAQILVEKEA